MFIDLMGHLFVYSVGVSSQYVFSSVETKALVKYTIAINTPLFILYERISNIFKMFRYFLILSAVLYTIQ